MNTSVFDEINTQQSTLRTAFEIKSIASEEGFEWPNNKWPMLKLKEEITELKIELKAGNEKLASAELGDVLFALVDLSHRHNLNPELARKETNDRLLYRDSNNEAPNLRKAVNEFEKALITPNESAQATLGDVFFAITELAVNHKLNPDASLQETNEKFIERFLNMQDVFANEGKELKEIPLSRQIEIFRSI